MAGKGYPVYRLISKATLRRLLAQQNRLARH